MTESSWTVLITRPLQSASLSTFCIVSKISSRKIRSSGWSARVISTFRPDDVIDPERENFRESLARLAEPEWHEIVRRYLGEYE